MIRHTYSPDQKLHSFHINRQSDFTDRYANFCDELDDIGVKYYYSLSDVRVAEDEDAILTLIIKYSDIIKRQPNRDIPLESFMNMEPHNNKVRVFHAALSKILQDEIDEEILRSLFDLPNKS